jgi:hypothetical protein
MKTKGIFVIQHSRPVQQYRHIAFFAKVPPESLYLVFDSNVHGPSIYSHVPMQDTSGLGGLQEKSSETCDGSGERVR